MKWMLKNSNGEPDGMFSFAAASFSIVSIACIVSLLGTITVGTFSIEFKPPDSTLLLGYLAACFTSYAVRRNQKDKIVAEAEKESVKAEDTYSPIK